MSMNKILSYALISNFVASNSELTADVTIPHSYIHYRREKYSIKRGNIIILLAQEILLFLLSIRFYLITFLLDLSGLI